VPLERGGDRFELWRPITAIRLASTDGNDATIHFRFAMFDTRVVADQIAEYVLTHAAQPLHGKRLG
jgi:hypothetical protein